MHFVRIIPLDGRPHTGLSQFGGDGRVDDPYMWETTWTARVPIRKTDGPLFEYACHEGNYGLVNMLTIARAEDRAAAAGSR